MPSKTDWVLLVLRTAPLDRIRIMNALFLIWYRSGKNIPGFFNFEPYLYGPYSLEVYTALRHLVDADLVVQPPHHMHQGAKYYLTRNGKLAAERAAASVDPELLARLNQVVQDVSELGFSDLLHKVYTEAPEFATRSIVKRVVVA